MALDDGIGLTQRTCQPNRGGDPCEWEGDGSERTGTARTAPSRRKQARSREINPTRWSEWGGVFLTCSPHTVIPLIANLHSLALSFGLLCVCLCGKSQELASPSGPSIAPYTHPPQRKSIFSEATNLLFRHVTCTVPCMCHHRRSKNPQICTDCHPALNWSSHDPHWKRGESAMGVTRKD